MPHIFPREREGGKRKTERHAGICAVGGEGGELEQERKVLGGERDESMT